MNQTDALKKPAVLPGKLEDRKHRAEQVERLSWPISILIHVVVILLFTIFGFKFGIGSTKATSMELNVSLIGGVSGDSGSMDLPPGPIGMGSDEMSPSRLTPFDTPPQIPSTNSEKPQVTSIVVKPASSEPTDVSHEIKPVQPKPDQPKPNEVVLNSQNKPTQISPSPGPKPIKPVPVNSGPDSSQTVGNGKPEVPSGPKPGDREMPYHYGGSGGGGGGGGNGAGGRGGYGDGFMGYNLDELPKDLQNELGDYAGQTREVVLSLEVVVQGGAFVVKGEPEVKVSSGIAGLDQQAKKYARREPYTKAGWHEVKIRFSL